MIKETRFSYAHEDCLEEDYDDGCMVQHPHGVHFTLWEGEKTYFFTLRYTDDGRVIACLVSMTINSVPETQTWESLSKADAPKIVVEAAAVIGREMTDESRRTIADLISRALV